MDYGKNCKELVWKSVSVVSLVLLFIFGFYGLPPASSAIDAIPSPAAAA